VRRNQPGEDIMRCATFFPIAALSLIAAVGSAKGQSPPTGTYTFTGSQSCLVSLGKFDNTGEDTRQTASDFIGSPGDIFNASSSVVSKNMTGTFKFSPNGTGQRIARGVYNAAPAVAPGANPPYTGPEVGAFVTVEDFTWTFVAGTSIKTPGLTATVPGLVVEILSPRKMFFYEGRYTKHTLTITTPPSIVDFSVKNNRYSLRNFGASGVLTLGTMSASESITVLDVPVPNTNIEVCSETVTLESTPQAVDSLPGGPPPTLPPPNE
jgi:hypothetical protein